MKALDLPQIQLIRVLLTDHIENYNSSNIEWLNFMKETLQEIKDMEECLIKILRGE